MGNYYSNEEYGLGILAWFKRLGPGVGAALILAVPFIIVDFFNYYSAGTALVLSLPLQILLYGGCGILAARLAASRGSSDYAKTGALAGATLWLISTVINTVIGLIVGTLSLGVTLLLGVPYLCLCAPFQLIGGSILGALGGWIYGWFGGRSSRSDADYR